MAKKRYESIQVAAPRGRRIAKLSSREARALIERSMRGHAMHRLYEQRMKQAKDRRPNMDTSPIDENYESEVLDPTPSEEVQLLKLIQAQLTNIAKEQLNIWKYTIWLIVINAAIVVYLIRGHLFRWHRIQPPRRPASRPSRARALVRLGATGPNV